MAIVLFDTKSRNNFYPLTVTKAFADLRFGILTLQERWALLLNQKVFICTENYLQPLYETIPNETHIWIDATILPNAILIETINNLTENECVVDNYGFVAGKIKLEINNFNVTTLIHLFKHQVTINAIQRLTHSLHILQLNEQFIEADFHLLTKNKVSQKISDTNKTICSENIFIEEGAVVECSILNATNSKIYIGKNVTIMEGCMIRGWAALCDNAVLKMGSKIYGATTIGKNAVAGGEIKNSIINNYSNKAHDGYLGDSIIGAWCNIGAGTSNSNIKNTAGNIQLLNEANKVFIDAGIKCGVLMGDYTRVAINVSINTGSVFGVCCAIFSETDLPKYIPHFSWGNQLYPIDKALLHIDNWKKLKFSSLTNEEKTMLNYIFEAKTI